MIRCEERKQAPRKGREAKVVSEARPFRQRNKAMDERCSYFANSPERSGAINLYSPVGSPIPCPARIDLRESPVARAGGEVRAPRLLPAI
ncbi:MAG: hypothetical protein OXI01_15215 [Albidovulum sp.]|nr:hypothetical protein [Albidovulum sp.]